jgi:hypothetical protein
VIKKSRLFQESNERRKAAKKEADKETNKKTWADASLSDKERWKSWQKAKDREHHEG